VSGDALGRALGGLKHRAPRVVDGDTSTRLVKANDSQRRGEV
jgi:hypothetical protein